MTSDLSGFSTEDILLELARRKKRAEDDLDLIRQSKEVKPSRVHAFDEILSDVATYYQLDPGAVLGGGKTTELVQARHAAIYFCYTLTNRGPSEIGRFFDGMHHTGVLYAAHKITDQLEDSHAMRAEYQELKAIITRGNKK